MRLSGQAVTQLTWFLLGRLQDVDGALHSWLLVVLLPAVTVRVEWTSSVCQGVNPLDSLSKVAGDKVLDDHKGQLGSIWLEDREIGNILALTVRTNGTTNIPTVLEEVQRDMSGDLDKALSLHGSVSEFKIFGNA
jgi:hypothetical protein